MKRFTLAVSALAAILATSGAPAVAQQRTSNEPGKSSIASFFVSNKGPKEAVPVAIQEMNPEMPALRVAVSNTPIVELAKNAVVAARIVPPTWEYQEVRFMPGQDPVALLNQAGAAGWETTGITLPATDGRTTIIMKRAR